MLSFLCYQQIICKHEAGSSHSAHALAAWAVARQPGSTHAYTAHTQQKNQRVAKRSVPLLPPVSRPIVLHSIAPSPARKNTTPSPPFWWYNRGYSRKDVDMTAKAYCPECGAEMRVDLGMLSGVWKTLVAYNSPPGHDHDDNCRTKLYECKNGHVHKLSVRNKCDVPGCEWKGKERCWCHALDKFDEWPE